MEDKTSKQLKLIAIVLPDPLRSFIINEQKFISENWGCRHALRTPPHITLIPPFHFTLQEINSIITILSEAAKRHHAFRLNVIGFNSFRQGVIFMEPELSQALQDLHMDLNDSMGSYFPQILEKSGDRPFHPHITLAHKDVTREQFKEIRDHYKNKAAPSSVIIEHFNILNHIGKGWAIGEEFILG
jgi:2'-5' RNA ligase